MADNDCRTLAVRPREMTQAESMKFAEWAVQSRRVKGLKSPQQAMLLMQYGRELGMGPATALQAVYEVNGTPALKANTIAALIKRSGKYNYRVMQLDDKECVLEFREKIDGTWETSGTYSYTMAEALNSGDAKRNPNYKTRSRAMLFSRCLTAGARVYCPDCLGGIVPYSTDELTQTDDDGNPTQPEVIEEAEFSVKGWVAPAEETISEEQFQELLVLASEKNLNLGNVASGLGADANDLRGMTQPQYEACKEFIAAR